MLDVLKVYCSQWRMFVNVPKTKVVVFNRGVHEWGWRFVYDGQPIELVHEFKYLGLLFHESGRKRFMIEHRLLQARRGLAMWRRRCSIWMLNGRVAERLFKMCVLLEYGVALWGAYGFASN